MACLAIAVKAYVERKKTLHDNGNTYDTLLLRQKLPQDMMAWRLFDVGDGSDAKLWGVLHDFFNKRGYTFWISIEDSYMELPSDADVTSSGFGYAPLTRGMGEGTPHEDLYRFSYPHPGCQAAQTTDGRSVVIRVLAIGGSGREHIDILKEVARGPYSLVTYNHALPLLDLLEFEDITFGVFPKVGGEVRELYKYWAKNSVGDILDILNQCLEALGWLHNRRIAHRDAFKDNFLVQWQPETMETRFLPVTRPRVYLHDFETAIRFSPHMAAEDCVCVGVPMIDPSLADRYRRPAPPEVHSGKPYDPYKLDVWQLSTSFADFKCHIPEIDGLMERMRDPDPALRPAAWEATYRISEFLQATPPQALYYPPDIACIETKDTVPVDVPLPPSPADSPRGPPAPSLAAVPPTASPADVPRASE
ncbi:uncharacterized protein TRAVEDRAFT_75567 [Trametes versicolor FP-101664 SS1]|uniref:Protein kinase domain-containing protein n=1 Tax=Trametes versicolor (strain FP-101664) TaxID=717944 RepID=R7S7X0_TRAVS|nr:uncharacterized protein TRAVEDRAFT_75567 [Trametes versicolor FP-101664 SS1]EIW51790.1 hypothetical protein TRAVEDRAFT_75567 [Trametes versicolor FP-101664 SS1]